METVGLVCCCGGGVYYSVSLRKGKDGQLMGFMHGMDTDR